MTEVQKSDIAKNILLETVLCTNYGFKQHVNYQNSGQCDICFDEGMVGEYVLETACGHAYHVNCILVTVQNYKHLECPSCRKPYVTLDPNKSRDECKQ